MRVLLADQALQRSHQCPLLLYLNIGMIGNRFVFVVLLNLVLFVLAASLAYPVHKLPDGFDNYAVEGVDVQQLAELGLADLAQLQEHPDEVSVGFREVFYLQQQDACIEIPSFSVFPALGVLGSQQSFMLLLEGAQAKIGLILI